MLSGWRAFECVIMIHGKVFELRIREPQFEIEHVRPLLEAGERGRDCACGVAQHRIQPSRSRTVKGNCRRLLPVVLFPKPLNAFLDSGFTPPQPSYALFDQSKSLCEDVLEILDDLEEDEEEAEEQNERMQRELHTQSLQTQQAISDLRMLIEELSARHALHGVQYGVIRRENERHLRCAFCDAAGQHYSDSCPQVRDAESRRRILDSERRCYRCFKVLLIVCPGGGCVENGPTRAIIAEPMDIIPRCVNSQKEASASARNYECSWKTEVGREYRGNAIFSKAGADFLQSRNCIKEWNLDAPSPFAKVCFNDLMLGYDFQGRKSETLTQKFICLYRFLLQQITDPPYRIQEFSVRKHDFVTDLIGYGDEDARSGDRLAEKMFYRTDLFKALQIALRDVRNYRYDDEEERFIPSNMPRSKNVNSSQKNCIKGLNWKDKESEFLIKLFVDNYDTYYPKFTSDPKLGIANRDALHEDWAAQVTMLGFSERSAIQVAVKIKKSIMVTRKFINQNGTDTAGRKYKLPRYLKPLEKKLREEYLELNDDSAFDIIDADDSVMLFDLLDDVKDETVSSGEGCAEEDELDLESAPSGKVEDPIEQTISMVAAPHVDAPVAPVQPYNPVIPTPNMMSKRKRRAEEELDELTMKKHRLLDSELELVERKRYLTEMKITYWEQKMKKDLNCRKSSRLRDSSTKFFYWTLSLCAKRKNDCDQVGFLLGAYVDIYRSATWTPR
ncbi:unnamed protein product [Cylicocyclus nassatus]|uniref:CCHC-type domain-containing protein n=1 Tax=Cylicocyclus nassatus TaxID=53992 RepID=A0AA36DLU1_CYLNA|nr:unnamed protein product [Cylicocyclus nassatus]